MSMAEPRHIPVLLAEVMSALEPVAGAIVVDGTFGAGGYTAAFLEAGAAQVFGIDRDPQALAEGEPLARRSAGRLTLIAGRFGAMDALVQARGTPSVDGIALDIGVSSMQIDRAERGFSFQADGPLDMRMGRDGPTAADVVNTLPQSALADIIYRNGDEPKARRIAQAITDRRATSPFLRTADLAATVERACGGRRGPVHPATRTFQALRIHVNDELGELAAGLCAAERLLKPGGRLAVVTFHSLEDRMVKSFLRQRSGAEPAGTRHRPPTDRPGSAPTFLRVAKPVSPGDREIADNPRARSARLRAAVRTTANAWAAREGFEPCA